MTSEFVDNLLKLLTTRGGHGLRLEAGCPAQMLDAAGSARNVSTRLLTRQEILAAIGPIVPEAERAQFPDRMPAEFDYRVPNTGDFRVTITNSGDQMSVSILRSQPNGNGTPKPAVPAAAAPQTRPAPAPAAAIPVTAASPVAPARPAIAVAKAPEPPPVEAPSSGVEENAAVEPVEESAPKPPQPAVAPIRLAAATPAAATGENAIDRLFHLMCAAKASDLHLCVGMPPLVRKDGEIRPLEEAAGAFASNDLVQLLEPIMPEKNRTEFERRHDTDFAYEIPGLARFRANIFMDRKGRGAVFRVIPSKILTAEDLGLSPYILELCRLSKGLVLVTGPTGSGKSTTLCAMVDYINRNRSDHIITIEDPIEFVHENKQCLMNQREVHTHTDSFKDALRAALREDPDIILVGEMRDLETVAIAIETAETGHLVFGTLHTTTAASTVDRIIDQFPADRQEQIRVMLSESLKGVISQTLCKKIGGGRVAAREILLSTPAISNLIREAKTFQIPSDMQTSRRLGMIILNDALIDLVDGKLVEPKEAYIKAVDKMNFANLLRTRGHDTSFLDGDSTAKEAAAAPPPPAGGDKRPAAAAKR